MTVEFDADKEGKDAQAGESTITPSGIVKCPNHNCALEGIPFPMPQKGTGICPVSKCKFEYESKLDPMETVVLKDGTVEKMPYWEVHGDAPGDTGSAEQKD